MGDIYEHRVHIRGGSNKFYIWLSPLYTKDSKEYTIDDLQEGGKIYEYIKKYCYDAGHGLPTPQSFVLSGNVPINILYYGTGGLRIYYDNSNSSGLLFNLSGGVSYIVDVVRKIY